MKSAIVKIFMLGLCATVFSGCALIRNEAPQRERTGKVQVKMLIDGKDTLYISGNSMWIAHHTYQLPGYADGMPVYVNDAEWNVAWHGAHSDEFVFDEAFALPTSGTWDAENMTVKFESGSFGSAKVVEYPSAQNRYTMIIDFDDSAPHSAHWYIADIDWDESK